MSLLGAGNLLGSGGFDPHPGFPDSGGYYGTYLGNQGAAAVPAADVLYLYPFPLPFSRVISTLFLRCTAGGAGSSIKAAIWANYKGRPRGMPLIAFNTGAPTTSAGMISMDVADRLLTEDWYWIGSKLTGTLPSVMAANSGTPSGLMAWLIGAATSSPAVGAPTMVGASVAAPYANDIAAHDLTGVTLTPHVSNGLPCLGLGFA